MENNEIMEMTEVMDTDIIEMETGDRSGLSTGGAMLIGAALTAATVAVVKLGKKAWTKFKARKEQQASDRDFVDVTDEDVENVAK
jgi:hypothetical protein